MKTSNQQHINDDRLQFESDQRGTNLDQRSINEKLFGHANIANEEMAIIKNDIAWMKDKINSMDNKLWGIIVLMLGMLYKVFAK